MTEFVLVIYIYAGMLAQGDSVAMQAVYGFKDRATCQAAGSGLNPLVSGSTKTVRFVCLEVRK